MKQNFVTQLRSTFKALVAQHEVKSFMENEVHSVDQCLLQVVQFLVHLTDLLHIVLKCNSFIRIYKAVVDQTGNC